MTKPILLANFTTIKVHKHLSELLLGHGQTLLREVGLGASVLDGDHVRVEFYVVIGIAHGRTVVADNPLARSLVYNRVVALDDTPDRLGR